MDWVVAYAQFAGVAAFGLHARTEVTTGLVLAGIDRQPLGRQMLEGADLAARVR